MKPIWAIFMVAGLILPFAGDPAAAETALERGQYLVRSIVACGTCHTKLDDEGRPIGPELAGGDPIPGGKAFTAYPANITPDPDTGIGRWTDEQLIKAIREGVRPDGSTIGPPMSFELYRKISDSDIKAIVTYLRSIPAVHNVVPRSDYKIKLPPSYGPPVGSVPDVPRTDKLAYGAYLAGPLGRCTACHTPMVGKPPHRDYDHAFGAGGFTFEGPWGISVSRNITPDPDAGLGNWTDVQIKKAITDGTDNEGNKLAPPMPYPFYAGVHPEDLDAIVAYLRTLEPIAGQ